MNPTLRVVSLGLSLALGACASTAETHDPVPVVRGFGDDDMAVAVSAFAGKLAQATAQGHPPDQPLEAGLPLVTGVTLENRTRESFDVAALREQLTQELLTRKLIVLTEGEAPRGAQIRCQISQETRRTDERVQNDYQVSVRFVTPAGTVSASSLTKIRKIGARE